MELTRIKPVTEMTAQLLESLVIHPTLSSLKRALAVKPFEMVELENLPTIYYVEEVDPETGEVAYSLHALNSDLLRYLLKSNAIEYIDAEDESSIVEALVEGGSIRLTGPVDLSAGLIVTVPATLNLDGNELSLAKDDSTVYGAVIESTEGTLTLTGEGIVNGGEDDNKSGSYRNAVVANGADIVIKSGTYKLTQGANALIYSKKGTISIYGGEFQIENINDGAAIGGSTKDAYVLLNCFDKAYNNGEANILVYGGKFRNFNPCNNFAEGPGTNFVAPGYKVVVNGSDTTEPWVAGMEDAWYEVIKE